ncbi:hypothetical protein BY996DRAFT_6608127 [Phakopsora pachyrhizi]|nr:hypothetical protein BY996DRAFT_6608127 [Phakopsora pachyrhizi]
MYLSSVVLILRIEWWEIKQVDQLFNNLQEDLYEDLRLPEPLDHDALEESLRKLLKDQSDVNISGSNTDKLNSKWISRIAGSIRVAVAGSVVRDTQADQSLKTEDFKDVLDLESQDSHPKCIKELPKKKFNQTTPMKREKEVEVQKWKSDTENADKEVEGVELTKDKPTKGELISLCRWKTSQKWILIENMVAWSNSRLSAAVKTICHLGMVYEFVGKQDGWCSEMELCSSVVALSSGDYFMGFGDDWGHLKTIDGASEVLSLPMEEDRLRLNIGQSEDWNLTVKASRGKISFWDLWRTWPSKDTTPEDGYDGGGTAPAVQQQKTELDKALYEPFKN